MSSLTKKAQIKTSFNYETVEAGNRTVIQQRTEEIKQRLRRAAQDIWEVGQKLVEVRSWLKHGQFEAWLKVEFGWSHRTAYNFISVYETFQDSANFAVIDVAASALYLLAAPSTPHDVRDGFLKQAQAGKKITYKQVHDALKQRKLQSSHTSASAYSSEPAAFESETSKSKIITVLPRAQAEDNALITNILPEARPNSSLSISILNLRPGWYLLGDQHLLFCGDTASPQFSERIPHTAFALAITSDDWDHDWLIERAKTVLVLQESTVEEKLIEQLLSMFTRRGEAVVFPWLPTGELIAVAHKLERQVYAGDPDFERCINAIQRSGLRFDRIKL